MHRRAFLPCPLPYPMLRHRGRAVSTGHAEYSDLRGRTLLTLIVIPAIFGLVKGFGLKTPASPIAAAAAREVTEFVE